MPNKSRHGESIRDRSPGIGETFGPSNKYRSVGVLPNISVIVLTYNEHLHIERCLRNAWKVAREIVVVDSGSTDGTAEIAARMNARVFQHEWINYATQLNWALAHAGIESPWVMRLDADEFLGDELIASVRKGIDGARPDIGGFVVRRYTVFQDRLIRHGGGVSPGYVLRIWRNGQAVCENRWMDEHMLLLKGRSEFLMGALYDHNLNGLTWWTQKHNGYASREAVDLLNIKYHFLNVPTDRGSLELTPRVKRWLKNRVYGSLPVGLGPILYFFYRLIFRLGFLDGRGMAFHFLQGLWYRMLVDLKVAEVERWMRDHEADVISAIDSVLGIAIAPRSKPEIPAADGKKGAGNNV